MVTGLLCLHSAYVICCVGGLSVGDLSFTDNEEPTDDDVRLSVQYFHSADDFVSNYVYPSVWLLQPLFSNSDSTTDWAATDDWLPFLPVLQILHIFTGQINCTASYE